MKEKIETFDAPRAIGPYSQAIKANGFVFVSGQLPLHPMKAELVEGDIKVRTERVILNLEAILKAAGSSLEKVVSCQIFLTDLKQDFSMMNEVYTKFFGVDNAPARATVEVSYLPLGSNIEISCTAIA